jgi:hypothetical protein
MRFFNVKQKIVCGEVTETKSTRGFRVSQEDEYSTFTISSFGSMRDLKDFVEGKLKKVTLIRLVDESDPKEELVYGNNRNF